MRIRRAVPAAIVFVALLTTPAAPAAAGGWDSLTFPKRHYVVGEVASTRVAFFAGALEGSGNLGGGPYHAYLLPETRNEGGGMIDPPTIPPDAIELGTLTISPAYHRARAGRYARASLSFVVPDVPTGFYAISFCDDPCVHSSVRWLGLGLISIVHTPYEAALLDRVARERTEADRLEVVLRRSERKADDLRARLDALVQRLRDERGEATTPMELAGLRPVVRTAVVDGPSVTWWIALLALVCGLGAGVALARRRPEPSFVVPDTVPEELEDAVRR
jgi:hypothetical protein